MKHYRQSAKTIIHDAENFGLVPIYEAKSGKVSTMDQELDICNRVYEIATYNMRRVCVTIKKYIVNKPPYFQNWLFTAKVNEQWNKLPMSTILWTKSKNCPKFWETLCLLISLSLSNALWWCFFLLIEILFVQNYLLSPKCTFRARVSEKKSDKT